MTDEPKFDMKELYGEFIDESRELMENIGRELVELEKHPSDEEVINTVFRSMHTLKGNAGFMGLTSLADLAHRMESVLGKLRDKSFPYFPEINDTLFMGLDTARSALADFIEGSTVEHDLTPLYAEIESLLDGPSAEGVATGEVS